MSVIPISLNALGPSFGKWHKIIALIDLEKKRQQAGLSGRPICTHMAFSRAPGTGKITVARLIGGFLKHIGVLEHGHLIEATREDLVEEYVGHTAVKTVRLVDEALGGVLLIEVLQPENRQRILAEKP